MNTLRWVLSIYACAAVMVIFGGGIWWGWSWLLAGLFLGVDMTHHAWTPATYVLVGLSSPLVVPSVAPAIWLMNRIFPV